MPLLDKWSDSSPTLSDQLHAYFVGPKWGGECRYGIDEESAQFIDGVLAQVPGQSGISVDRTRLRDSREAWIFVNIGEPSLFLLYSYCTAQLLSAQS